MPGVGLDELDWEVPSHVADSSGPSGQEQEAPEVSGTFEAPVSRESASSDSAYAAGESDLVAHLVQDREVIDRLQEEDLPPDEYYEELEPLLQRKFPGADPDLVAHAVQLAAAFDVATVFAMSFGVAKFQLAQTKVKLVGEIVGREGRSPNGSPSASQSRG